VYVSRRSSRVLIVEDEPLIAMALEDMLGELGFEQIRVAHDLVSADCAAEAEPPDLAILDVNIGRDAVFPLAEKLGAEHIPIVFSTGWPSREFPPQWANRPLVPKPADKHVLDAVLCELGFNSDSVH
jgi:two-component SAPR family response regulator